MELEPENLDGLESGRQSAGMTRAPLSILAGLVAAAATLSVAAGCASIGGSLAEIEWPSNPFDKTAQANLDDAEDEEETTRLVGRYVSLTGSKAIVLQGVGLVTGLNNTGGDLPPSNHRRIILEDMKRRRVANPNQILQHPTTAVVNVRVYVPPLAEKGEQLDVEVNLPEGSEATSLSGGMLQECHLYETAFAEGRGTIKGDALAKGAGRILLTVADESEDESGHLAGVLRRGVIPGGGRYTGEPLYLGLSLLSKYRSVKMAKRIEKKIGVRFHDFNEYGLQEPMATAKSDSRIELKIPDNYRENPGRYLQIIRSIPVRESTTEQRIRMEKLRSELMVQRSAARSARQLEAIGRDAIPILKDALTADGELTRFHAAEALAYLGDSAGVQELATAARENRTSRVWAFLALQSLTGGEGIPELVTLLDADNIETRYGAVRAISTVDPRHPSIQPVVLGEGLNRYLMRTIDHLTSGGDPAIHITKRQKAEITLFNERQEFRLPLTARAGQSILVVGHAGGRTIEISRVDRRSLAGLEPNRKKVVSRRVEDVITACAELGANYPDIVRLLMEADRQHNLPGQLAFDALPTEGRRFSKAPKSSRVLGEDGEAEGDDTDEEPAIDIDEAIEPDDESRPSTSAGELELVSGIVDDAGVIQTADAIGDTIEDATDEPTEPIVE